MVNNHFFVKYGLIGLFLNGLLSSIFPLPAELTISALLLDGQSRMLIFLYLLLGSIIGGFLAYYVGYGGNKVFNWLFYIKKPKKEHEDLANALMEKYGWVAILICPWIPVGGDVIPILAGVKKLNFKKYAVVMIAGKVIKIVAIIYILGWLLPFVFQQ